MLDPRLSRYYGLDRIGHRIWDLLERPQSVSELCAVLEGEFDIATEACRADVCAFLQQLQEAELLDIR